jgi:hypothetical protein
MTPSKENFTAWIDGRLSKEEAEAFEKSLGDSHALEQARNERDEALKLGTFLRTHWKPAELGNADFFTHQLLAQIEASEGKAHEANTATTPPRRSISFGRLFGLITVGYAVAAMAALAILQPVGHRGARSYYAEVRNSKPGDAKISANAFHSKKANVTVLWLEGLDRVAGGDW